MPNLEVDMDLRELPLPKELSPPLSAEGSFARQNCLIAQAEAERKPVLSDSLFRENLLPKPKDGAECELKNADPMIGTSEGVKLPLANLGDACAAVHYVMDDGQPKMPQEWVVSGELGQRLDAEYKKPDWRRAPLREKRLRAVTVCLNYADEQLAEIDKTSAKAERQDEPWKKIKEDLDKDVRAGLSALRELSTHTDLGKKNNVGQAAFDLMQKEQALLGQVENYNKELVRKHNEDVEKCKESLPKYLPELVDDLESRLKRIDLNSEGISRWLPANNGAEKDVPFSERKRELQFYLDRMSTTNTELLQKAVADWTYDNSQQLKVSAQLILTKPTGEKHAPEAAKTEPAKTEPAKTEPAQAEPEKPQPERLTPTSKATIKTLWEQVSESVQSKIVSEQSRLEALVRDMREDNALQSAAKINEKLSSMAAAAHSINKWDAMIKDEFRY
jgi:hypothetical protein